eukprot:scaffold58162_cov33-Tisochrysis_lutea.AAC.2
MPEFSCPGSTCRSPPRGTAEGRARQAKLLDSVSAGASFLASGAAARVGCASSWGVIACDARPERQGYPDHSIGLISGSVDDERSGIHTATSCKRAR